MFIKVFVCINNKVLSFNVEDIPVLFKKFRLGNQLIDSLDGVTEISITEDLFIIKTEDPGFRNGNKTSIPFDQCSVDIIKAYNWNGELQWSINDIIPDLKGVFLGGFLIDRKNIDLPNGFHLPDGESVEEILSDIDQSHPLYACFDGGWRYILDLKDKRILFRSPTN